MGFNVPWRHVFSLLHPNAVAVTNFLQTVKMIVSGHGKNVVAYKRHNSGSWTVICHRIVNNILKRTV
jgi:hypothetical protein